MALKASGLTALQRLTNMKGKPRLAGFLAIQFPRQGMFLHTQTEQGILCLTGMLRNR